MEVVHTPSFCETESSAKVLLNRVLATALNLTLVGKPTPPRTVITLSSVQKRCSCQHYVCLTVLY
ncbi:hypothetical protein J6590_010568 [Homalodisca vitripennis]|nr:hypothetical protein J6590_010568 [Homalodisca vitripennis]